jgi:hypothetical protein
MQCSCPSGQGHCAPTSPSKRVGEDTAVRLSRRGWTRPRRPAATPPAASRPYLSVAHQNDSDPHGGDRARQRTPITPITIYATLPITMYASLQSPNHHVGNSPKSLLPPSPHQPGTLPTGRHPGRLVLSRRRSGRPVPRSYGAGSPEPPGSAPSSPGGFSRFKRHRPGHFDRKRNSSRDLTRGVLRSRFPICRRNGTDVSAAEQ